MKAHLVLQCDGRRPVCRRCNGYGYECLWRDRHSHSRISKHPSPRSPDANDDVTTLRRIIRASQDVLSKVREKVNPEDQRSIDVVLASSASLAVQSTVSSPSKSTKCVDMLEPFRRSGMSAHRYLGEISDVSFFNSVKALLQNQPLLHGDGAPLESYEREAAEMGNSEDDCSTEASLVNMFISPCRTKLTVRNRASDRGAADKYITIYFSTIHIAYPFVDRRRFLDEFEKYWNIEQRATLSSTSVALLCEFFECSWWMFVY